MTRWVYDIEADGLLDEVTHIHCIVLIDMDHRDQAYRYFNDEIGVTPDGTVADALAVMREAEELIAHNERKYDIPALWKVLGWSPSPTTVISDTLVMSKTRNPDRPPVRGCKGGPHSLEAWGIRLGVKKPHHEEWGRFSPEMLHRCVEDVRINALTYDALKKEEAGFDYQFADWLEGRLATEAILMEQHGWPFHKKEAEKRVDELSARMAEIEAEVIPEIPLIPKPKEGKIKPPQVVKKCLEARAAGVMTKDYIDNQERNWIDKPFLASGKITARASEWLGEAEAEAFLWGPFSRVEWFVINLGSDKEVKKYLLSLGWRPTEWNISKKTGMVTSPKLTEDSYDSISSPVGATIAEWLKCSHRRSQISGWVAAVREDGRLPSVIDTMGCPTLRMKHKVIVNVPSVEKKAFYAKEMRSLFVAEPGYVIVGCDAASCQLRLLTHYMDDDDYRETVLTGDKEAGTDVHSVNMRAAGLDTRGHAKNFIYGFLFGAGFSKVGRLVGGGEKEGRRITNEFLNKLPALKRLREELIEVWKQIGYLTALDGRPIYVRKQHELLCYLLQAAESLVMKLATCYALDAIRERGLDARLLNIMHDEYSFMVRDGQQDEVSGILEESIRLAGEFFGLLTPMDGDAASGATWADVH